MLDSGIDNSNKELAITLVWQTECDLDLHVTQPDGFEIYFLEDSSEHGFLNQDIITLGNKTHAIEVIAFETAPIGCYKVAVTNYGECSPGVDYTYFIKIRDRTEGSAPAEGSAPSLTLNPHNSDNPRPSVNPHILNFIKGNPRFIQKTLRF